MRDYTADSLLKIFPRSLKVSPDYWTIAQVVAPELERLFNAAMLAGIYYRVNELPDEETEHFREAVVEGHADTLLAASVFHFGTFTVRQVKAYLAEQGIRVRG